MLSVSGKSRRQFSWKKIGTHACLLLTMATTLSPATGLGQYGDYDRYRAAGAPPLNRMVYDRESGQWGYWSVPGGEQGYEIGEDDPQPLNRDGLRVRRAPRPVYPGYGYTDDEDMPPAPRMRRHRRPAPPPLDIPVEAEDERTPWAPRGAAAPSRPAPARTTTRPDLPESEAVTSAASARRRGERIPGPEAEMESRCDDCATKPVAGARAGGTVTKTSHEVLKAVGPKPVRSQKDAEEEERREYEELPNKPTRARVSERGVKSDFVRKLLKFAAVEANRRHRVSSGRHYRKNSMYRGMGLCLQGVRMALQQTKGQSTGAGIGTAYAKNAGPYLMRDYGYRQASTRDYNPQNLPPGSILIYRSSGDPRHAGHIEIKGTSGFYSDYFSEKPINELMPGRRHLVGVYLPPSA